MSLSLSPSDVVDIYFPTPSRAVVVWRNGYGVGDLPALLREPRPLPLGLRLADLAGIPVRLRIGGRERLAIWQGEFLLTLRPDSVARRESLRLPGGVEIRAKETLTLSSPGIPEPERQDLFSRKGLVRAVISAAISLRARRLRVWAAGLYQQSDYRGSGLSVRAIAPDRTFDLFPQAGEKLSIELACGMLGIFSSYFGQFRAWAGRLDRGAIPSLDEAPDKAPGWVAAMGFSRGGRILAEIREQGREKPARWRGWIWTGREFALAWDMEIPPLPDPGWTARISPDLKWMVRAGNRVWAIPLPEPPVSLRWESLDREVSRRILG